MSDDRYGTDLLRRSIDEVAATLPVSGPVRRRPSRLPVLVAAGVLLVIAGLWGLRGHLGMDPVRAPAAVSRPDTAERSPAPALGVRVQLLRLHGRDVGVRVVDATKAGTILVMPDRAGPTSPVRIQSAIVLQGGSR